MDESQRLTSLEESALFAERRLDELHEQVLALSGRVEALARRLDRFEALLARSVERGPEDGSESDPGLPGV